MTLKADFSTETLQGRYYIQKLNKMTLKTPNTIRTS